MEQKQQAASRIFRGPSWLDMVELRNLQLCPELRGTRELLDFEWASDVSINAFHWDERQICHWRRGSRKLSKRTVHQRGVEISNIRILENTSVGPAQSRDWRCG